MTEIPKHEVAEAVQSLQTLSDDDLRKLLDDDAFFEIFVTGRTKQGVQWLADTESYTTGNKATATYNLSLEPKLNDGKAQLLELYEQVRAKADEVETKRAVLDSLSSKTSLDTTYALLQAASAETEEKSDEVAESFLNGSIDLESFTTKFVPLRVTAHLRRLKTEKMAELMASFRQRSHSAPYPTAATPYMPMPGLPMSMPGLPR